MNELGSAHKPSIVPKFTTAVLAVTLLGAAGLAICAGSKLTGSNAEMAHATQMP